MTMHRVKFTPSHTVHIDVDAPNAAKAIEVARDIWNRNALYSQFVRTESRHDACFDGAHAIPLKLRFLVRLFQSRTLEGWVSASSQDDAIETAEDQFQIDPDFFYTVEEEVTEISVVRTEEDR